MSTKRETERATKLIMEWRDRLRLGNWWISMKWVQALDAGDFYGRITIFHDKNQAVIELVPENQYSHEDAFKPTLEQTIIHELLHLRILPPSAETTTDEWRAYEANIDSLAWAIHELKYDDGI